MTLFGRRLPIATALVTAIAIAAATLAPPDQLQGELQRLMYVHVPTAWVAYLSFAVTLAASVAWLWRRTPRFDRIAASSAEAGVFFTGLAIALGSVWGKPTWGVWWTWDPRVVTTAVMFFVYVGYLALRQATPDPLARARRSAVFGVVAFVQVPIVHMSVVWWRALHQPPTVLKPGAPTIDGRMLTALLISVLAFSLFYLVVLRARVRLAVRTEEVEAALAERDQEPAGNAVLAPQWEKKGLRADV
ncbi:cytochrome c assembly protein [Streptomyces zinciresistens K42]|uniref:Heme exporter protein C n=1 Tax=Streptomyces zinciresistens K42 TaxID=700597 RepID=G2GM59_9ACTN|nr:cytochrome c biogenesis protein CcsA [Streptomyces zinciresistens]EGX55406.1 cytochrome c assembly protein [Streptomyces zinciresistens K42]